MSRRRRRRKNKLLTVMVLMLLLAAVLLLFHDDILRMGYPLQYETLITQYAGENDMDPYLIAGVIHTESRFQKGAMSRVGACGLMQIMPETGQWLSARLGLVYQEEMLFDAETNIRLGSWYLRFLLNRYGGDLVAALAAYNAGPGRVDGWLEEEQYTTNGVLTAIPFTETRNYVERVQHAKRRYQELYTLE